MRIRSRVADAHVIDGIDNAATKKMRPEDVGDVPREIWVLRRNQPARQGFAASFPFDLRSVSTQEFRAHDGAGHRMLHLAIAAIEDDRFARIVAWFATHLGEKCGETVVIVHHPPIKRMVVALGALDAHSHKNLRGILGNF